MKDTQQEAGQLGVEEGEAAELEGPAEGVLQLTKQSSDGSISSGPCWPEHGRPTAVRKSHRASTETVTCKNLFSLMTEPPSATVMYTLFTEASYPGVIFKLY